MESFKMPEKLDIRKAMTTPTPESVVWQFREGTKTFFQIDSDRPGHETEWYLTHDEGGDPARWYELEPTFESVCEALVDAGQKSWTDEAQVFNAMLPALRGLLAEKGLF